MELEQARVLVTGCSGRIGAAACAALLSRARSVRGYDLAAPPDALRAAPGFDFVRGDVADSTAVAEAVRGCTHIVHLAAVPDDADWNSKLLPANVQGAVNIFRAIETANQEGGARVRRCVVASSGKLFAGYGRHHNGYPLRITDPIKPVCAYGATKAFVEAAAQAFSSDPVTGCDTVCLRFAWCPRTAEDVQAMRDALEQGYPDEFLSPSDAATAITSAVFSSISCSAKGTQPPPPPPSFKVLFVQSRPGQGRVGRFDISETIAYFQDSWHPQSVFPAGIDHIVATRSHDLDVSLRKRDDPTPGRFLPLPVSSGSTASDVRARVSAEEWNLRVTLAAAYRVFAMHGWVHAIHTHITVKVPEADGRDEGKEDYVREELFLINPYGLSWEEITASSLIKVKADGGIVDQGSTNMPINPAGFKIHSAVHTSARGKRGGDIVWTMHTHTMETVAVSNMRDGFRRGLSQFAMDLGPVRLHEFEHATAGDHVCAKLVEDLGDLPCKTLLMRNHGCMTVGRTVGECYFRLFQLIRACEVQCACAPIMEDVVVVPDETVAATFAITENDYTGKPFGYLEWRAAVRQMRRIYGDEYAK